MKYFNYNLTNEDFTIEGNNHGYNCQYAFYKLHGLEFNPKHDEVDCWKGSDAVINGVGYSIKSHRARLSNCVEGETLAECINNYLRMDASSVYVYCVYDDKAEIFHEFQMNEKEFREFAIDRMSFTFDKRLNKWVARFRKDITKKGRDLKNFNYLMAKVRDTNEQKRISPRGGSPGRFFFFKPGAPTLMKIFFTVPSLDENFFHSSLVNFFT